MSAPRLEIRRATDADAAAIAEFAVRAFTDAYGPLNEPADVRLHIERTFGTDRQAAELATPGVCYLLAVVQERIVGYALLDAQGRHPAIDALRPCEIRRFYVDRAHHGSGVAGALLTASVATARTAGACALWLTTWEHSARARRFYARNGFEDVGTATFMLGASAQTDRLLLRRIA